MSINYYPFTKDDVNYSKVIDLYEEAFPESQHTPLWLLRYKVRTGTAQFNIIYENDTWVGLIYTTEYKNILFVQLFAISKALRSGGYGSKIIGSLKVKNPGKRIVLNIEEVDGQAENKIQKVKRKVFYERSGFISSGYIVKEFGERYEMLIFGGHISKEEIYAIYKNLYGFVLGIFFKAEVVRI